VISARAANSGGITGDPATIDLSLSIQTDPLPSSPSTSVATDPFTGQNQNSNVAAVSSTNDWAVGGQRLCTFRFKRFVTLGWQQVGRW
jgi:hypothetical protein